MALYLSLVYPFCYISKANQTCFCFGSIKEMLTKRKTVLLLFFVSINFVLLYRWSERNPKLLLIKNVPNNNSIFA